MNNKSELECQVSFSEDEDYHKSSTDSPSCCLFANTSKAPYQQPSITPIIESEDCHIFNRSMVPKAFVQVEDGTPSQQIPNPDKNARRRLMLWICAGGVLLVGINLAITLSLTLGSYRNCNPLGVISGSMNSTGAQTVYPTFYPSLTPTFWKLTNVPSTSPSFYSTSVNANYTPAVTTTAVTEDFQSTQTLSPTRGNVPVPTILPMLTSPPVSNPTSMSMPTISPFSAPVETPVAAPVETPVSAPIEDPVSLLGVTYSPIEAPVLHPEANESPIEAPTTAVNHYDDSAEYYYECQGGPKLLRSLQEQF